MCWDYTPNVLIASYIDELMGGEVGGGVFTQLNPPYSELCGQFLFHSSRNGRFLRGEGVAQPQVVSHLSSLLKYHLCATQFYIGIQVSPFSHLINDEFKT